MPPVAVTGVNGMLTEHPLRSPHATAGTASVVVMTEGATTLSVNDLRVVAPAPSVTVIWYDNALCAFVGVPLIAPVDELMVMPDGNVPDVSAKENGEVPPLTVTGVSEHEVLSAHEPADTESVEPSELSVNDLADDGLTPSFTVTVNVV